MQAFYKLQDNTLMHGTSIEGPAYSLQIENYGQYQYPVDGWRYFATLQEAVQYYGLVTETITIQTQYNSSLGNMVEGLQIPSEITNNSLQNFTANVEDLNLEVDIISSLVETLSGYVDNVNTDLGLVESNLNIITTNTNNVITSIGTLQSASTTTNSNITTLQTNVTTLQAQVSATAPIVKVMTALQSTTAITWTNATDLVTPSLGIGRYKFEFFGIAQSVALTTGIGVRVGTGTATLGITFGKWNTTQAANGVASSFQTQQLTATTDVPSTAALAINTDFLVEGTGIFNVTNTGTVAIQFRSEVNASGVSLRAGSTLVITKIG